jgi:hypothetical protein
MNEGMPRREADNRRSSSARGRGRLADRPDRIALWAVGLAVIAMIAAAASAHASTGGTDLSGGTSSSGDSAKYSRIWDGFTHRQHRWAHKTSECESGGNPDAIGGDGKYRGAFQFTKPTWRHAPKSPGGDPVKYVWRTQAVVAVKLKQHEGTKPWPVCG